MLILLRSSDGIVQGRLPLQLTLIRAIWSELFDIFQINFSTDFPFVHPPTFLKPLRQMGLQPPQADDGPPPPIPRPPASATFLLAFLALTARFHPVLIAHHSPATSTRPSNPIVASEYYANAANARVAGSYGDNLGALDIECIQALLMLGLHEWGMCRGARAWITVGIAVRSAQLMGLQYEQDLDDEPLSRSMALHSEAQHFGIGHTEGPKSSRHGGDAFVKQEIRRRTFWSCVIMDRYLSSGKHRPQMLDVKDLRIQLPSSERAFLFGEKVRTLLLGEETKQAAGIAKIIDQRRISVLRGAGKEDELRGSASSDRTANGGIGSRYQENGVGGGSESGRWEVDADEGIASRYIRALEIYGRVVRWSCSGGRRRETYPPWDERCGFYRLRILLHAYHDSLPHNLILSPQNIAAHITSKTSTPYTLIHTVYLLCHVMLHREYLPFIPIRCSKPEGPLDPPLFPPSDYETPPSFWDDSARECFKAARDIMDLVRTCQEWGVLVETPIVGFAIYTVAFVGVYCINFPQMDPDGSMCKAAGTASGMGHQGNTNDGRGAEAARKALEMIGQMRRRLKMAEGWFQTIRRMHLYYIGMKKDYRKNALANNGVSSGRDESPEQHRRLSLREGGPGGGLEGYKLLEKTLKDLGSLEDEDLEMVDVSAIDDERGGEGNTDGSEDEGKDLMDGTPDNAIRQERWNAINTVAAAAASTPMPNGGDTSHSHRGMLASSISPKQQSHVGSFRPAYPSYGEQTAPSAGPASSSYLSRQNTTPVASTQYERSPHSHSHNRNHTSAPLPYGLGPLQGIHAYASAQSPSLQQAQQPPPQASAPPPNQAHWPQMSKEEWLNNLDTRLGSDDLAAFVAGSSWEDWRGEAGAATGPDPGWLRTIFATGGGAGESGSGTGNGL
ncbi:hypothetical protein B0A49_02028 [Cryomyces minteri]|uniref:Xylanolytic transcriptional activator regulatory domain-containing protein n=1 Tax=Cryomyces minteri TaxID=331657 RepID=A0A4V5NGB1_9PEZI|nr:hypothetical protein B0A49_02028 [Cryomyces minteri]